MQKYKILLSDSHVQWKQIKPCVLSPEGEKPVRLCVPEKVCNKENKQTLVQFQHMLTIAKLFLIYHCTV